MFADLFAFDQRDLPPARLTASVFAIERISSRIPLPFTNLICPTASEFRFRLDEDAEMRRGL